MNRMSLSDRAGLLTLLCCVYLGISNSTLGAEIPNILWISCEDISPNLGCYGDPHAFTPNLDALAKQGVRYTRAFTPAGVCAVVRSGLIMAMYSPSIGTQHMRSHVVPPAYAKAFPEYLRAAGYFCTNRDKTDYQFNVTSSIWDRQGKDHSDWRERPDPKQPFFSVINLTMTHESQVRHSQKHHDDVLKEIGDHRHDLDATSSTLPAYLPNTLETRTNWAWYHDNITLMDKRVGEILARLEADGLSDSTLVVFWSDHGMGLPRGKRWVHDTGTHIPLLVRWPGKLKPASLREDLTSILDLPPTMLKVAGIDVPKHMHGRVLFTDTAPSKGASDEPPYLFFHRDRMDEVYELQRSCRDRRWRYIRNFEPEKPYSQQLDYMDQMPAMIAWRRMAAADQLVGGQKNWFAKTKPIEELYDTEQDPWELNNLALQGEYADRLKRMREATEAWQVSINDMGLIPEAVMMEEMLPGDKTPQTEVPVANVTGGQLSLTCLTEGSSIVYRVPGEKGKPGVKNPWLLYVKSISVPDGPIEFQASRLGYRESPIVQWNAK